MVKKVKETVQREQIVVKLVIPGIPVPKQSTKFVRRGNFVGTYKDMKVETYENLIKIEAQKCIDKYGLKELLGSNNTPLFSVIRIYLPKPSSKGKRVVFPCWKPDLDNLQKVIFDGLSNVLLENDSRICMINVIKLYDDLPRTEIEIGELPNDIIFVKKLKEMSETRTEIEI